MAVAAADREIPLPGQRLYNAYGAAMTLMLARDREIVLAGPANTGKSRGCLEKLHICAAKYDKMRGLIVRKTRKSITQSVMVTFEQKVLPEHWQRNIRFHHESQEYRYPNGSRLIVGGLDDTSKIMSTEYDMVYVQETREIEEAEWEDLITRLRNHQMPYQQIIGDTNPDAPTHWIKQRGNRGSLRLLESRHEDNPTFTDGDREMLDALTGVRHKRLRLGLWVAAEGQVYEEYDPAMHLIDRFEIPPEWGRFLAVDFGYTNPFVCQWWAEDPDGRLYRYRELYHTHRLVEDHACQIKALSDGETIRAVICDHDAEDRATLERHLGMATEAAHKAISPGIQAVASRLRSAGDGRPRLLLLRDSLVERDLWLTERKWPNCTEEEFESYIWDLGNNRRKGELPVDRYNHGMDAMRYVVASRDLDDRQEVTLLW